MSLEAAIQENTAALNKLIAIMGSGAKFSLPAEDEPDGAKPATRSAKPEPVKNAAPAMEAEKPVAKLTYEDVKGPFLELCKSKGADAGRAVLKQFDAAKLPDVPPEKWADALAAINEASA